MCKKSVLVEEDMEAKKKLNNQTERDGKMMARKETNSTAQTLVTKQKHKLKSVNYQKHAPLHNIGVNIQNTHSSHVANQRGSLTLQRSSLWP